MPERIRANGRLTSTRPPEPLPYPRAILIDSRRRRARTTWWPVAQLGSALLLILFGVALGIAWVGPFLHGLIVRTP